MRAQVRSTRSCDALCLDNRISDAGAAALGDALKVNGAITTLCVSSELRGAFVGRLGAVCVCVFVFTYVRVCVCACVCVCVCVHMLIARVQII